MKTKLLLLSLLMGSYTWAQMPSDQIALYTFTNGDLTNVADPGNGDLSGGAVPANLLRADRFGTPDAAIRANAILRNGYQFTGTNNELSISFWIQGGAPTGSNQRIFQVFDTSGDGFSMRTAPSNTLIARFKNAGVDNASSQSNLSVFNGSWHQIVFTIKRTSSGYENSIYIDGILNPVLSTAIDSSNASNFLTSNATFIISPISYFGNIDDVEIFDRELTAGEVNAIFTNSNNTVNYVDVNATGNNDGSSWSDAYTDLQSALDNTTFPTQIWVAQGTYLPTAYAVNSQQGLRDRTFLIERPLYIYGGFDGTETDIDQRDLSANPTVLSGDLNANDNGTVTTTEATRQDNVYHVVTIKGDFSIKGEMNGFTISGGNASSNTLDLNCATAENQQFDNRRGAAIVAIPDGGGREVLMKFSNLIVENNSALGMAALHTLNPCGSADTLSDLDFENSIIRNNYSIDFSIIDFGASRFLIKRYGSLINCLVYNNETTNQAAAIRLSADSTQRNNLDVQIINSTITNNTSTGSIITCSQATGAVIRNTIIYGNTTSSFSFTGQNPTANNNIIEGGFLSGLNQDPLFTDSVNDDYTLQSNSPAIDAGLNTYLPNQISTDLLGNNRIHNTTVDMGAYEFGSTLGIENTVTAIDFTLYPNPASHTLNIKMDQEIIKVAVYNMQGQEILTYHDKKIDVSGLSNGIYIIRVQNESGSIAMKRFIKK